MKKLIIILFLFLTSSIFAQNDWYVATDGSDSNTGADIDHPWATWGKAFTSTSVQPGDTVYFRGGVYTMTVTSGWGYEIERSGTITDTLCYFNYPGEVPILDCGNVTVTGNNRNYGLSNAYKGTIINYVKFKGLTVRNVLQTDYDVECEAWHMVSGHLVFERCNVYNIGGRGFYSGFNYSDGEHWYINCDGWNCSNPQPKPPSRYLPGNRGVAFSAQNFYSTVGHTYYINCRAWKCGDQGFSPSGDQYCECDGCWAFLNGIDKGDGYGFKLGWIEFYSSSLRRVIKNCVSVYNRAHGFSTNDNGYPNVCHMNIYNNTSYHNGYFNDPDWPHASYGFKIYNTSASDAEELERKYRNNLSYANENGDISLSSGALYTHEYNSWDNPPGVTITDADFLSVDSTGITASRQADGSLPDNDCYNKFLRLSSTSLAYQAGVDVGLTYDAVDSLWRDPPSIGAYEYYSQETPEEPAVLSEVTTFRPYWQTGTTAISGGNVFDDGGADVAARGVCWSTSPLPTIVDDHTSDGTGTGIFYSEMTGLNQNWIYYIRAYATNEVGTAYGNQMTFRTNQVFMIDDRILRLSDGRIYLIQ